MQELPLIHKKKKHGGKIRKDTAINIIRDKTHHKKHC